MRRIEVDADFLTYFSPRSEVRQANEIINREIVGSNPFYVVVEGPEAGALKRWINLWLMKDLQKYLRTLPGYHVVDLDRRLPGAARVGAQHERRRRPGRERAGRRRRRPRSRGRFWEDPAHLEPVLKLVAQSPETFSSVVTPRLRQGQHPGADHAVGLARDRGDAGEDPRVRRRTASRPSCACDLTGNLVLLTGTTSEIVAGQVKSLALALGVIFVVLALMFLSVRIGFLAILPERAARS